MVTNNSNATSKTRNGMMEIERPGEELVFPGVIADICNLNWSELTQEQCVDVAWAYYYFSIQFRENLQIACSLFPNDEKLKDLEREECNTDNLSPWDGVAEPGEKMNHDEFMWRLLNLHEISDDKRQQFQAMGDLYLNEIRAMEPETRARSIASYEDGGLEQTFTAMLRMPAANNPSLAAFRHFLSEHIRFDSDPDQGHGALSRHLRPDDRILPLWVAFRRLFVEFVPELSQAGMASAPQRAFEPVA
jgi:hypothetical protein